MKHRMITFLSFKAREKQIEKESQSDKERGEGINRERIRKIKIDKKSGGKVKRN